jgi:hypothetical protein
MEGGAMKIQVHLTQEEATHFEELFRQGKLEPFNIVKIGQFIPDANDNTETNRIAEQVLTYALTQGNAVDTKHEKHLKQHERSDQTMAPGENPSRIGSQPSQPNRITKSKPGQISEEGSNEHNEKNHVEMSRWIVERLVDDQKLGTILLRCRCIAGQRPNIDNNTIVRHVRVLRDERPIYPTPPNLADLAYVKMADPYRDEHPAASAVLSAQFIREYNQAMRAHIEIFGFQDGMVGDIIIVFAESQTPTEINPDIN